jgi:hypothetical protein
VLLVDLAMERRTGYHDAQERAKRPYRLPKLDKIAPITVDRAVHCYNSIGKYLSNMYLRNEKLLEIIQFSNVVLDNPPILLECPVRKNKFTKINTCFNMIREIQAIENTSIELLGLNGLEKQYCFDQMKFQRSYEYIRGFNTTSVSQRNMAAVMVARKLHVYDFISQTLLFQINFPSAGAYCLKNGMSCRSATQKLYFLENDLILAF